MCMNCKFSNSKKLCNYYFLFDDILYTRKYMYIKNSEITCKFTKFSHVTWVMFQDNAEKEEQIKRALRDKRNVEAELEKVGFFVYNQ